MAYAGAVMRSGVDKIIDLAGFDQAIQQADLILTGEGRSDAQTLLGKVPCGVLRRAAGIPVALVSGAIEDSEALRQAGFAELISVSPAGLPLQEALEPEIAANNIRQAVRRLLSTALSGKRFAGQAGE
jgi:glycerate kinase